MQRRSDRTERLLDLVSLFLSTQRPLPWEEIRELFPGDYAQGNEASCLRKWERDKAELVELGIPLEWEAGDDFSAGGYRLDRQRYYLPELDLSEEERMLLLFAGSALTSMGPFPLRRELLHALDKLVFSGGESGQEPSLRRVLHGAGGGEGKGAGGEHLEELGEALAKRKDVSISYRAFDGSLTERRVSPYAIAFRRGSWVLVGLCQLRAGIRTFSLERIQSLALSKRGLRPDFELPADFDLQEHVGREAWELGVHRPVEVQLRADAEIAPLLRKLFADRAQVVEREDGSLSLRLRSSNNAALVRLVLQLAPRLLVESPSALRQEVYAAAQAIATQGEATPPSETWAEVGRQETAAPRRQSPRTADLRQRFRRALFLIPYALAHAGCSVEELAQAARLSPEELLRELDFLRMVGRPPFSPADLIDIDVVDGRVEVSLPQGLLRPPSFSLLEIVALDAAVSALEVEGGEAMQALRAKLRSILPPALRPGLDELSGRVQVESSGIDPETTQLVDAAIEGCLELEFTYFTQGRGESTRRAVRPLERVLHQGYWYLHAYCCTRKERRLFRLDRAAEFALSDRAFLRRETKDISLFEGGRARRALLRLRASPADADFLRRLGAEAVETEGGGEGEGEGQGEGEGSLIAYFPLFGDAYLVSVALSFGGAAEILEPVALRERMQSLAREVAASHAE